MKVILEAFGGKLRSQPMDFPEEMKGIPEIHMMLDMDIVKTIVDRNEYLTKPTASCVKRGRFVKLSDSYPEADIYTLVHIS